MKLIKIIFLLMIVLLPVNAIEMSSIMNVTIADSSSGLLQGVIYARVEIYDYSDSEIYWNDYQAISFEDGFAEIFLGPVNNLDLIETPYVRLKINNEVLNFPIHPVLYAIHSQYAGQLSNTDALFIDGNNVGLGVTDPTEKLTIDGNLLFENDGRIIFSDSSEFDHDILNSILSDVETNKINLANISALTINSIVNTSTMNIQDVVSSYIPTTSYSSSLTLIDSDGSLTSFDDFFDDSDDSFILLSQDNTLNSVMLSSDFTLSNSELMLTTPTIVVLNESATSDIIIETSGAFIFDGSDYFLWSDESWQKISYENSEFDSFSSNSDNIITINSSTLMVTNNLFLSNLNSNESLDLGLVIDPDTGQVYKRSLNSIDTLSSLTITNNFILESISVDDSLEYALMIDSLTGKVYQQKLTTYVITSADSLTVSDGLLIDDDAISIDTSFIDDSSILFWEDSYFSSVAISNGLDFSDGELSLAAPFYLTNDSYVGIGVSATTALDVSGSVRLRAQDFDNISTYYSGMIIFDGDDFKGWNGNEWQTFSSSSWTLIDSNLTVSSDINVGINVDEPEVSLDVSGSVRLRSIDQSSSLDSYLVMNDSGDLFYQSLELSDLIDSYSELNSSILYYDGSEWRSQLLLGSNTQFEMDTDDGLRLSSMNATNYDLLSYIDGQWQPSDLTASGMLGIDGFNIYLVTNDVNVNDLLYFDGSDWSSGSFFNSSDTITYSNQSFILASQDASVGEQLTWNGSSWVPSTNASLGYSASNGIVITDFDISLADNLEWSNDTLIIGSDSNATLNVNYFSSSVLYPLYVDDSSDESVFFVNSDGQLSIGFSDPLNYSIASNGYNYFANSISRYQSSVGTTNVGTDDFGPTLLIQSVYMDDPIDTRTVVEVLDVTGNSLFEVQENGYVGIGEGSPQATLDINGFARLNVYDSEPVVCSLTTDGSIALTSQYTLCVCKSDEWVETNDGNSSCSW